MARAKKAKAKPKASPPRADDGDRIVSTKELETWLGVSKHTVTDLAQRGAITQIARDQWPLKQTILAAFRHYRDMASGRGPDNTGELVSQRARLAREQADATAMHNAALRGETVPIRDVIAKVVECNHAVVTRLMALPAEASPQLHACRTVLEHQTVMRALMSEALEELCSEFGSERRQLH